MKLDFNASCDQNALNLFSNPTLCFVLSIATKCNKSMIMKIKTFFDYGASTWFIEKELVQQLKLPLVKKITLMIVEVIN